MINFATARMGVESEGGKDIEKVAVWWITPFGVLSELSDAVKVCVSAELSPNMYIKAYPVAISGETWEPLP